MNELRLEVEDLKKRLREHQKSAYEANEKLAGSESKIEALKRKGKERRRVIRKEHRRVVRKTDRQVARREATIKDLKKKLKEHQIGARDLQ
jgi:hypothetical protein